MNHLCYYRCYTTFSPIFGPYFFSRMRALSVLINGIIMAGLAEPLTAIAHVTLIIGSLVKSDLNPCPHLTVLPSHSNLQCCFYFFTKVVTGTSVFFGN